MQPRNIDTTEGGQYRLRVPAGKDTDGNDGKPRDAYFPANVERDLQQFQNVENIAPRESFIELKQHGVRVAIKRTAQAAVAETADEDFRHVSSHDLRRRFAQRLLVDENMNPWVVMQVGGRDSFAAIEPYLNAPTLGVVDEAFQQIELWDKSLLRQLPA